ncbi:MAG: glycosyltransferase [Flavobacterium sp.]|nr:MAG: glycosyltransferase [Flavobacterium sp.]
MYKTDTNSIESSWKSDTENKTAVPLITIGIPNFNYATYIVEALESVRRQTYPNVELIIIDDSSTDNSVHLIESWIQCQIGFTRILLIKNPFNRGVTAVCQQILENALGEYIQFLDADDTLLNGALPKKVDELKKNANAAFIYTDVMVSSHDKKYEKDSYLLNLGYNPSNMPSGKIHEQLFEFNFIPFSSVLMRTSCIRNIGGLNEAIKLQDYYLWLRLSERYNVLYLPEVTALYRVHKDSFSNHHKTSPKLHDSVLNTLFLFYRNGSRVVKKSIRKRLHYLAPVLFKEKYPTALYWLKQDLFLNPGIKSFILFLACWLKIPYRIIANHKKVLHLSS